MNGFDDPRGPVSEELAVRAERAWRGGSADAARALFAEAAELETAIARDVPPQDARVRGVLAVSAVALWYKAAAYGTALRHAFAFLAEDDSLDEPSRSQLQELVERCWRDREAGQSMGADTTFEPLEIKLSGGEVRTGVAPVAAVRERQALVATLLVRTAEWRAQKKFRVRGEPSRDIARCVQILEAPARAASYGLRLYVASGPQQDLPVLADLTPRHVVDSFLDIAAAAQGGDEALSQLVADPQYRHAFLAGFRDIAPDGAHVAAVTFEHPVWDSRRPQTTYEPRHRDDMTRRLAAAVTSEGAEAVDGVLKVVNLKARAPSIEIVPRHGTAVHIRIDPERFAESLGTQLNKFVTVTFEQRPGRRRPELHALDISLVSERDEMPWERDARIAVETALASVEWYPEEQYVTLLKEDHRGDLAPIELFDLNELKSELGDMASAAWHGSVPHDGGEAVFDADTDAIVENALDAVADKIAALGWD